MDRLVALVHKGYLHLLDLLRLPQEEVLAVHTQLTREDQGVQAAVVVASVVAPVLQFQGKVMQAAVAAQDLGLVVAAAGALGALELVALLMVEILVLME